MNCMVGSTIKSFVKQKIKCGGGMAERKDTKFLGFWATPAFIAQVKVAASNEGYVSVSEFIRAKIREGVQAQVKV